MSIVELLAAIVRGDRPGAAAFDGVSTDAFCATAEDHGMVPLVAAPLADLPGAPPGLRGRVLELAQKQVAADLVREAGLREVLASLDGAGVRPLLMKGGQLAYSHYPRPDLRPRLDTDILIPDDVLPRVHEALSRRGYEFNRSVGEEMVMSQRCYTRHVQGHVRHVLDVHWKVANPRLFAHLASFEELEASAVPLPWLSPVARGLSDVHALLVACVHRVAHHLDADCLIWLYDIHLIASRFAASEWDRFVVLAADRQVTAICRASLQRTVHRFQTSVPSYVFGELDRNGAADREATAGYLVPRRRVAAAVIDDLRALPSWADRWRLLREHVFPRAIYMREVYAPSSAAPLPLLYARRVWRGARKWLERP